jgi:hypothetical protein
MQSCWWSLGAAAWSRASTPLCRRVKTAAVADVGGGPTRLQPGRPPLQLAEDAPVATWPEPFGEHIPAERSRPPQASPGQGNGGQRRLRLDPAGVPLGGY